MSARSSAAPLALGFVAAGAAAAAGVSVGVATGQAPLPAAFAGLIVAGAVVIALATRPAWLLCAGIGLAMFNAHWDALGVGVPLDRVAFLLAIVCSLRLAWQRHGAIRTRPIDWLLVLVTTYAVVSAIIVGTLDEHDAQFTLLDRFGVVPFLLFFVAAIAFRDERDRKLLVGTLVAMGAYLGITAIFETTGPRVLVVPHYINNPGLGIHYDRARGPFLEAAGNGLALYGCAVGAVIGLTYWYRRKTVRWVVATVALLSTLGVLLSLTRAPWLGAIAGTIVAMLSTRMTRRLLGPTVLVGVALIVVALATIPGLYGKATARKDSQEPLWDRRSSNSAALRMVDHRPLLGFGWGEFGRRSLDFYRQGENYPLRTIPAVHNVYLANATELGLVGASLWVLVLVIAIGRGAFRRRGPPDLLAWRVGLLAFGVAYLVVAMTTPLGFALPTMLLWMLAGVAWSDIRMEGRWAAHGARPAPAR